MFQFGSFSGLCFAGLRESMRQAELNNWSLEPTQIADLCSSINQFFARTGVIQQQGPVQPPVCHGPMHPNKPSQHLNTGETPLHRPVPKNARFKMRSIVLPRSYRCRKLQLRRRSLISTACRDECVSQFDTECAASVQTSPNWFSCIARSGNLYIDTRQGMSMMGPPGYPHMPPMNATGPTMTGNTQSPSPQRSHIIYFSRRVEVD